MFEQKKNQLEIISGLYLKSSLLEQTCVVFYTVALTGFPQNETNNSFKSLFSLHVTEKLRDVPSD